MSIDFAVVTVAAQGIRMLPLTKSQPREMLPVGRKPAVQYVVEELQASGVQRLLFITGPDKSSIENHFNVDENLIQLLRETCREEYLSELDFERAHLDFFFRRQRRQLGLGHAVLCAKSLVGNESFIVALGDSILGCGRPSAIVPKLVDVFESRFADAVVAIEEVSRPQIEQSGIVAPAGDAGEVFEISYLLEKPSASAAPSNLAIAGRYVCRPILFDYLDRPSSETGAHIELTEALSAMAADGRRVYGVRLPADEHRYDIGDFESYFRAFVEFALADKRYGPPLAEHVRRLLSRGEGE